MLNRQHMKRIIDLVVKSVLVMLTYVPLQVKQDYHFHFLDLSVFDVDLNQAVINKNDNITVI